MEKLCPRCLTARSKTSCDPPAGPASIKLENFGVASYVHYTYVHCILRRRLDEQPDEKEAGKEPRNTSSLLCIRLIFRAFPADIGMQVRSVIWTGPATRCSESFVTSRQSLTLSSRGKRQFSDHREVKTAIIPAGGGGSENCVTISEGLIIRNNRSRSWRLI